LVVTFEELDPAQVIRAIRPDVLVKGGDWPMSQIVGADFVLAHGGSVRSLPYVDGSSTTTLIHRIQSSS
jgi:bifunctional ADP-heptose synthase (sugar kinase/adenylyltransferase)